MKILSFDGESNGLHGSVFAIGGCVYENGVMLETFFARCPLRTKADPWVRKHVLPMLVGSPVTHKSAKLMRSAFWKWLKKPRKDTVVVADVGWPVEAGLLSACVADDPRRRMKGPYPLHEVATLLLASGMDPMKSYGSFVLPEEPDRAHNPVYDSRVSALCAEMALKRLGMTDD